MAQQTHDTIVAVSSPPGAAARGLIRLSGDRAHTIAATLLTPGDPQSLPAPRTLARTRIHFDDLEVPALLARFDAPASYTGQDMVELQLPGHLALLDRLLHALTGGGARLAEPGEFTFRAYLAGKLDLTRAEGVSATIAAVSDAELAAAEQLRSGQLGHWAQRLVDQVSRALALIEAGIDFTDQEDVVPIGPAELDDNLRDCKAAIDDLLGNCRSWGALEALPRIVLVGAPSTGKSTLFNTMLGRERAVVSHTPGTTRDILEEPLTIDTRTGQTVEVMLVDIAGLDSPAGALDHDVQQAARRAIAAADVILHIDDGQETTDNPAPLPDHAAPTLHLRTKIDQRAAPAATGEIAVSALTGAGMSELHAHLADILGERSVSVTGEMLALQPRHEAALRSAAAAIERARSFIEPRRDTHALAGAEIIAGALRDTLDDLAGLGGEMTPDDVIGKIFATFCVGK